MFIKIIIAILILAVFAVVFKYYVLDILLAIDVAKAEDFTDFKYKPANTIIAYYNIGEYPWNRHTISSSIPYDVKVKDDATSLPFYELDNETYNAKLKEVFGTSYQELIVAMEGTEWSEWIDPKNISDTIEINKLVRHHELILNIINTRLTSSVFDIPTDTEQTKIQIVHDIMNRYRYNITNKNYYLYDIEMIFYRDGKIQGKHIKIYAITDGSIVHILRIKIIGVISQDNIMLFPYVANDALNTLDFDIFVPEEQVNVILRNDDSLNEDKAEQEIESILYKKLVENHNYEHSDLSNNSYNEEKEVLLRTNFKSMVNNFMQEE